MTMFGNEAYDETNIYALMVSSQCEMSTHAVFKYGNMSCCD